MASRSGEPDRTKSENSLVRQGKRIHLLSLQTLPLYKRDQEPNDRSIYTHEKWSSRLDQPDEPRESNNNVPTLWTEARIKGRSIANGCIFDQSFSVQSNQAWSATSIVVRKGTNLQKTSHIWMQGLCVHPTGEKNQAFTPCNKMHISRLRNQWGIRVLNMGSRQPEIDLQQGRSLQWRLYSLSEPVENSGQKGFLSNRQR